MAKILITGGSGLVGSNLSDLLAKNGHEVRHLSRSTSPNAKYKTYRWNLKEASIDEEVFDGLDHIVHLAGAGVADERWTRERKKVILDSRVDGIKLLHHYATKLNLQLKSFVSASAIGYYGADRGVEPLEEDAEPGSDFLAEVVKQWEAEADTFRQITKVSKIRIGVVLSEKGGAMVEILKPIRMYAGAPLGSGRQLMSWIHINDLSQIFRFVIEKELAEVYNAAAPNPVTNQELTKALAAAVKKPLILPNVPAFAMKLILGEMAQIVLGGSHISSDKIQSAGFKFRFTKIEEAVKNLIG